MARPLDTLNGQARVREYLSSALAQKRVSHAYLFVGPAGSGKAQAAYAFAASLVCEQGGCGTCDACRRVMRGVHPDVRRFSPEGASGYLVEQIREVVSDTSLAPIQAKKKVYILDRVELLGVSAANAFLKTLEEPPHDVVLILLARMHENVLPTIVSRCQVIPFRHIPSGEASLLLAQKTGADAQRCLIALEASGGSLERAEEFVRSHECLELRQKAFDLLASLDHADEWDVLKAVADLIVAAKAPLDEARALQEEELAAHADFLGKAAVRQIEARNKRAISAKSQEMLFRLTAIIGSWIRDALLICAGTPELVVNVDARAQLEAAADRIDETKAVKALAALEACNQAISYNVSPETSLDVLLLEIREVFNDSGSAD